MTLDLIARPRETKPDGQNTAEEKVESSASSDTKTSSTSTLLEFDINPRLHPQARLMVERKLRQLQKECCFATSGAPAPAPDVEHVIHLTDPHPIKQNFYRSSPAKTKVTRETVESLLARGLIVPSSSPWSSPTILVPKVHTGEWRMCIDYRKLNARTKKDAYPIPLITDCLQMCKKADYFTLIDIKDAYHHVPMAKESEPLTAFCTPDGLYQWKRMPFGLCNAPATFQRYVDKALRGLIGVNCAAFFDDCLVFTTGTLTDHLKDVEVVMKRLADRKLEANIKKCQFAYWELRFVGHIVSKGTIRPDPEKIAAVKEYPPPINLTQLRSFLGLANYYHRFVPGYARIALPLYQLTRKNVEWNWTAPVNAAFEALKTALVSAPCLHAPDFTKPFTLETDASKIGLAGILTQLADDGQQHPVAYISRQLNKAEQNYHATELECLAVIWAVGQFEPYLIDRPFTLVTDHSALVWLPTKKFENTRVMRWAMKLQEFKYDVRHRAGALNPHADAFSRAPRPGTDPGPTTDDPAHAPQERSPHYIRSVYAAACPFPLLEAKIVAPPGAWARFHESRPATCGPTWTELRHIRAVRVAGGDAAVPPDADTGVSLIDLGQLRQLVMDQRADPVLSVLIAFKESKLIPANFSQQQKNRLVRDGQNHLLLAQRDGIPAALFFCPTKPRRGWASMVPVVPRLVVPPTHRVALLAMFHDAPFSGHLGQRRTYRRLANRYFWDTQLADVIKYVESCETCKRAKIQRSPADAPPRQMHPPTGPFELLSMDFIGPLNKAEDFTHVLVVVDHFTQWAIAIPTKNTSAETVASVLVDEVFHRYGLPLNILSDRASNFRSTVVDQLHRLLHVKQLFTSAWHPQANGKVERLNATLKDIIHTLEKDETLGMSWIHSLQPAIFAYNTSVSETTNFSPFYLLFGRNPITPGDAIAMAAESAEMPDLETLEPYVYELQGHITNAQGLVRSLLEAKHDLVERERLAYSRIPAYKPGDLVWSKNNLPTPGQARPDKFTGPWTVRRRFADTSYELERTVGRKRVITTVHVSRLQPYKQRADPDKRQEQDIEPASVVASAPSGDSDSAPMDVDQPLPAARVPTPPPAPVPPVAAAEPVPADDSIGATVRRRHDGRPRPFMGDNAAFRAPLHEVSARYSQPRRPDRPGPATKP